MREAVGPAEGCRTPPLECPKPPGTAPPAVGSRVPHCEREKDRERLSPALSSCHFMLAKLCISSISDPGV